MLAQQVVDDFALNANAAAVDDPDFAEALESSLIQVLLHHNVNLARLERMQVDGILNRDVVHPA